MDKKKFLLRIDPRLYDALQRWADDELRSVNSQIESVLRDALRHSGRLAKDGDNASRETKH
ncbi:MAG: Arc family DNA-binding protein [Sporolactobacillus sp.]